MSIIYLILRLQDEIILWLIHQQDVLCNSIHVRLICFVPMYSKKDRSYNI